ncbi:MAG: RuBisCO accumulation factor 1 [Microcoleaceae cyanobacterium]
MTSKPQNTPSPPDPLSTQRVDSETLVQLLRRKEATWVDWGQACAALQKSGYSSQHIFEETGFEPVQQNQVMVASQVYTSLVTGNAPEPVRLRFQQKGSDILYEFRILSQSERIAAAELVLDKNLDVDEAKDLAKAIKDFSRLSFLPEGFLNHPGDAVAYQSWRLAQEQKDLQERSRLIAKGLRFAHSSTARQQLENLLTDFTVIPQRPAPRFPLYRLESDESLPRIIPVVGEFPLTLEDLKAVPLTEEIDPFRMVKFSGSGAWVPIPGWQVIVTAEDPVAILVQSDRLPGLQGKLETMLIVVDRAQRQWDVESYFLVEHSDQLELQWFEQAPEASLHGRMILLLRPKKVLDEDQMTELWQIED